MCWIGEEQDEGMDLWDGVATAAKEAYAGHAPARGRAGAASAATFEYYLARFCARTAQKPPTQLQRPRRRVASMHALPALLLLLLSLALACDARVRKRFDPKYAANLVCELCGYGFRLTVRAIISFD